MNRITHFDFQLLATPSSAAEVRFHWRDAAGADQSRTVAIARSLLGALTALGTGALWFDSDVGLRGVVRLADSAEVDPGALPTAATSWLGAGALRMLDRRRDVDLDGLVESLTEAGSSPRGAKTAAAPKKRGSRSGGPGKTPPRPARKGSPRR